MSDDLRSKPITGVGVGLRSAYFSKLYYDPTLFSWYEIQSEDFFNAGGQNHAVLEKIRQERAVTCHGVSLSIGSSDPINFDYLESLKKLIQRVEPCWVSDHLAWCSLDNYYVHDLLPLPYTEESLWHVIERIKIVQDYLGRQILIENISQYLNFKHSDILEWEFINAVAREADCFVLLDINNIYVSAYNLGFSPDTYLNAITKKRVKQFHLAGYSNMGTHLLDTHNKKIHPPVINMYQKALKRFGAIPTAIEWDSDFPDLQVIQKLANDMQAYQETRDIYEPC